MAERRMISECIWCSDVFESMSTKAQQLYKHIYFAADDDGFCDCPRQIMNKVNAKNSHMNELIDNKFILKFDKPVVVVKHWHMQNQIRKDRCKPTKYQELYNSLYFDENKSYSKNPGAGHIPVAKMSTKPQPNGIPNGNQLGDEMTPQYSIGKYSIDKSSLEESSNNINNTLNNSFRQEEEIGDSKGEEEILPVDLPEKTESEIEERKAYYQKHITWYRDHNINTEYLIRQAAEEGIYL